jgi:glycosyltransferase involved in cell wall biosynthesis
VIVGQRNSGALADEIQRLLGNPAERVRLASQARQLVEAEFDVHRNAARLRELWPKAD